LNTENKKIPIDKIGIFFALQRKFFEYKKLQISSEGFLKHQVDSLFN